MTNLRCTNCNEVKLESEFNFKNKSKGIRNSWCKSCVKKYKEEHKEERKEYDKKHYVENKEEIKECNKKYREENRELFKEHRKRYNDQRFKLRTEYLLAHPCVDCGESDPIVLEFDHIRGEKDRDIAYMILTNCPLGRIKAEIAKCEVRCSNCHRRRHNIEGNTRRVQQLETYSEKRKEPGHRFRSEHLLTHHCVGCGESDPSVLHFDHIRGEKDRNVSVLVNWGYSLERIKAEIAKCEVRCANCHRRRHNQVIGGLVKRKYEALPEDPQD